MSFQLPKESRDYFKHLLKRSDGGACFSTLFDLYYFCLMMGFSKKSLGSDTELEGDKFIEKYTSDYQNQADVIAGLLINAELTRKGIEKDDRSSIEHEMLRLLDHQSPSRLSEEGINLLNLYACSGFKAVRDELGPPQSLEEFLVFYHRLWSPSEQSAAVN